MTPFSRLSCLIVLAFLTPDAAAATPGFSPQFLQQVDRPFAGEKIALSPSGRHLAYTEPRETGLHLVIADLDRRTGVAVALFDPVHPDAAFDEPEFVRWVAPDRLIIQFGVDLFALNADGTGLLRLWDPNDDGIVNDYEATYRFATPAPVKVLPLPPPEPDSILLDAAGLLGGNRSATLYVVNHRTGQITRRREGFFFFDQKSLYGPGSQDSMARRNATGGIGPVSDGPSLLTNPDFAVSGTMHYDQPGLPRILYGHIRTSAIRRYFAWAAPGNRPGRVDFPAETLDIHLGILGRWATFYNRPGEFELRPNTYFGERSYVLGFDYDPDLAIVASNKGRDTFGLYSLNLKTRERIELAPGIAGYDLAPWDPDEAADILVYDHAQRRLAGVRYTAMRQRTHWIDPELRQLQTLLDGQLPAYAVEIVNWDDQRRRFALRVTSEQDPGGIFLYDRETGTPEQIVSRAPGLAGIELKPTASFSFRTPAGVNLTGYVTLPTNSILNPPPLIIYCAPGLWDRAGPGFNREAQVFADMGYVVLRLNYRGSTGFGRQHLLAIQKGLDTVPVEDFSAAIDWIAARRPIDRKRVAIIGEGFGGYLALRSVENRPDLFRAAVGINAPTNLTAWAAWQQDNGTDVIDPASTIPTIDVGAEVDGANVSSIPDAPSLNFNSLVRQAFVANAARGKVEIDAAIASGNFRKPVLLINDSGANANGLASLLGRFRLALESSAVERLNVRGSFLHGSFNTRRAVFEKIEGFLNTYLYEFAATSGELKEVRDEAPARK